MTAPDRVRLTATMDLITTTGDLARAVGLCVGGRRPGDERECGNGNRGTVDATHEATLRVKVD